MVVEKPIRGLNNGQLLYSQLLIDCLVRMESMSTDKNELISFCRKDCRNNKTESAIIDQFEQNYCPCQSIWWYTRNTFLYRVLNDALRNHNIDVLFLFRFFIRDIAQQPKQH